MTLVIFGMSITCGENVMFLFKTRCPKKVKSYSLRHPALHSGVEAKTGAQDQGLLTCRLLPALRSPT